ncbi:MAG TPA: pyridoxamine 5'-phosphate oxidase family protein [Gemmatimonadales bacterium]|nr:pyridoxamine 5'-phosphate oxidase family protein [Gemmatimonadales bacterium]
MTEPAAVTTDARLPTRAAIRAHPERDRTADAPGILAAGLVAHVGFVDRGRPTVIPMTYQYAVAEPRLLYLHGGVQGRLMAHLATGAPVCVAVTELDGLVYSRTALNHSVNYRSVVAFARAAAAQPPVAERERILAAMIARYFPGRAPGAGYEPPTRAQLDATALVALEIEEWSAKVRSGGPNGPGDDDPARPGTAGVIPMGSLRADVRLPGALDACFAVRLLPGPAWDEALPLRSQAGWPEHAAFMDALTAEGFVVLGGPLAGGEAVLLVVAAESEGAVRERLAADPWHRSGQLSIDRIDPWRILLDGRG